MINNTSTKNEIIMGIDPGTRITGYGIIQKNYGSIDNRSIHNRDFSTIDFGCIRPPPKYDLHQRYLIIFNSIEQLIEKYRPTSISIETQFVKKNAQSAIKLGMARGVVIIAGTKNNIPIYEYSPKKAKNAVVGNGQASKHQIQKMVPLLLNLKNVNIPEDAADALALALCHAHQNLSLR